MRSVEDCSVEASRPWLKVWLIALNPLCCFLYTTGQVEIAVDLPEGQALEGIACHCSNCQKASR